MWWSIPYGPEKVHGWGPEAATLNWCEEDYYLTTYCAEIINTLTKGMVMYLGWKGLRNCISEGHDRIFLITFLGYLLVGCGSFLFHATLWYSMQLVDELSMIYTTCLMCWATFGYGHTPIIQTLLGLFLLTIAGSITLIYHHLQDPIFHQNAYGFLTTVVLCRSWYLMETRLRSTQSATVTRMWTMVRYGLSFFLSGFLLWNADNAYCSQLRLARRAVGMPWGWLLEGHGWWHLLTGWGAYYYIVYGIWLRSCLDGKQGEYECVWERVWSLPVVRRRKGLAANGEANGTGNGVSAGLNGEIKKKV